MSKENDEDDYDPHLHRVVEQPLTNCESLTNLIKSIIGNGVLALPLAFRHVGWISGIIGTIVIGAIIGYAKYILLNSMYELCKREHIPYLTYSESVAVALKEGPSCLNWLSKAGRIFLDSILATLHFGICCVYVIFLAESIKEVADYYISDINIRIYIILMTPPLILIYLIRNLKHLAPFSTAANILLLCGYGIVMYYILSALPALSTIEPFQDFTHYPLFYGTVVFATEAVGLVIVIEADMKNPKDFLGLTGVFNLGMTIILFLNTAFGFLGYWRYGDDIRASISLNLPEKEILPSIIKVAFAIAIYFSYPLQGYIPLYVIWIQHLSKKVDSERQRSLEYLMRVLIVIGTVICSVAFPNLGLFLALVGSSCFTILGTIIPAIVDMCTRYKVGYGFLKLYLLQDILLLLYGVTASVLGTFVAVKGMIADY